MRWNGINCLLQFGALIYRPSSSVTYETGLGVADNLTEEGPTSEDQSFAFIISEHKSWRSLASNIRQTFTKIYITRPIRFWNETRNTKKRNLYISKH